MGKMRWVAAACMGGLAAAAVIVACVDTQDALPTDDGGAASDGAVDGQTSDASAFETGACSACPTSCYGGVCNGKDVVQIEAGGSFACALNKAGEVWCWGADDRGQLGVGHAGDAMCGSTACQSTAVKVASLTNAIAIGAGDTSACAVLADHSVWCWGENTHGTLGHDKGLDTTCGAGVCNASPVQIAGFQAKAVAVSDRHACAITTDDKISCWGENDLGQLGSGIVDAGGSITPTPTGALPAAATKIVLPGAAAFACALSQHEAYCWGGNGVNQDPIGNQNTVGNVAPCGGGSGYCVVNPLPVENILVNGTASYPTAEAVTDITHGGAAGCMVQNVPPFEIECWGDNPYCTNAAVDINSRSAFVNYAVPAIDGTGVSLDDAGVSAVAGKYHHFCAIDASHGVRCWGSADLGQLGDGSFATTDPKNADGDACRNAALASFQAQQITAGRDFTVFVDMSGKVQAVGKNDLGQLGHLPGQDGDAVHAVSAGSFQANGSANPVLGLP